MNTLRLFLGIFTLVGLVFVVLGTLEKIGLRLERSWKRYQRRRMRAWARVGDPCQAIVPRHWKPTTIRWNGFVGRSARQP